MGKRSLSGFFWDVDDYFSSTAVQRMTMLERGVYDSMLFEEWRSPEKSLPDDADAVAELLAITAEHRAEILQAWPVVRRKFVSDRRHPGRIFNVRLEHTRRDQTKFRHAKSKAGAEGGKAKAAKYRRTEDLLASKPLADASTELAKPSVELRRVGVGVETGRVETSRGRDAGRIYLHRWQLEDLIATLGPHADTFGLDEWIDGLTAKLNQQNLALPTKELRWSWVQGELAAEIQARRLPVAAAASDVDWKVAAALAGPSKRPHEIAK